MLKCRHAAALARGSPMRATMWYLAVLIAFVALSPHSYSQTVGKRMEGIGSVRISALNLNEEAADCGVTKVDLRSAASNSVGTSRLRLSEGSSAILEIDVLAGEAFSRTCIAAYRLQLVTHQKVKLNGTKLSRYIKIQLWERNRMIWGPRDEFGTQVRDAIENLTKEFVVDWRQDQQ